MLCPPSADGVDGEAGGVVIDADADPAGVAGDVVDPVGHRAAKLGDLEVMHAHRFRLTLRPQFAAGILEVADQFFLLGVDRDCRLAGGKRRLHRGVDVLELRVAVGRVTALAGLAVGLQAVAELAQQVGHHVMADAVPHRPQRFGEMAQAAAGPEQRRLGIAACAGRHQRFEVGQQRRIVLCQHLAAAAGAPHTAAYRLARHFDIQLGEAAHDGTARQAGDPRDCRYPAAAGSPRLGCRKTPPAPLVQHRIESLVAQPNACLVNHHARLVHAACAPESLATEIYILTLLFINAP
jgi:hypothetical protein